MADATIAAAGAVAATDNTTVSTPAAPKVADEAAALAAAAPHESMLGMVAALEARATDPVNPDPTAQMILAGLRAQIAQATQQQQVVQQATQQETAGLAAAGAVTATTPDATLAAAGAVAGTATEQAAVTKLSGSSPEGDKLLAEMGLSKATGGRTQAV